LSFLDHRMFVRKASPWHSGEPVREELFSVERLEEHARSLAAAQPVAPSRSRGHRLARRLGENAAALLEAHRSITRAIEEKQAVALPLGRRIAAVVLSSAVWSEVFARPYSQLCGLCFMCAAPRVQERALGNF
jgi:hypothetical protein